MKAQAIIPAAGVGSRFGTEKPKPLIRVKGKPVFVHTLEAFEKAETVDSVLLIVHEQHISEYEKHVREYRLNKVVKIVRGDSTRAGSVAAGLNLLDQDTGIVVVHDGVRPLIKPELINRAVSRCEEDGAVIVAVPVKSTVKKVDAGRLIVLETVDRDVLWAVQTPQVFKKEIIVKAYEQDAAGVPTDDSTLVENMGVEVKVIRGEYSNIKITAPEDLITAEALLGVSPQVNKGSREE